jgi:flagellar hook assembly protein FlgD
MDGLTLNIYRISDRGLVGALSLPGLAAGDRTYDWDGRLDGASLPDGTYLLQLVGVRGGMSYAAPAADMRDPKVPLAGATFTVDTAPPAITPMSATQTWISPDGDGRQELARLTAVASAGAVRWSIWVADAAGTPVRTFSGEGGAIDATWDGRDAAGALVAEGPYLATASGADEAGNAIRTAVQIGVDVRDPQGTVTASPKALASDATSNAFSPNGDGWQDAAMIRWTLDEAAAGTISVRSPTATIWTARIPTSVAGSVAWNGRDRSGRAVAEGTYTVVATVADAAGNPVAVTAEVRVDRTVGFLRASPGIFFPNDGDALARTTRVSFRSSRPTSTTLRVIDASGQVVRTAWQARTRDAGTTTWTWDGRDDARAPLPSGYYRLELIASAGGVQQVIVRGLTLDAFLIAPSSRVVTAGRRLTVIVTSAEPLRKPPTVTLAQVGLAARSAAAVKRSDGRFQVIFTIAPGGSGPATVTVAGTDTGGHRNLSQTTVTVQ